MKARRSCAALGPLLFALACAAASGCALFSKSDPVVIRYFTPEAVGAQPREGGDPVRARVVAGAGLDLRLGRVNAASYLKDRIAFRDSNFEVGYYEILRWTERPEAYLRRALGRALFQEQGVRQIISGPGPTLDVDLDAFEELREPRHAARVQLTWVLHDDQHVEVQETFTVERPIPSGLPGGPRAIAPAMAAAFQDAVKHLVERVMVTLPKSVTVARVDP